MKRRTIPTILKHLTTLLMLMVALGVTAVVLILVFASFGAMDWMLDLLGTFQLRVPVRFVPIEDSYTLFSDELGNGEIVLATGTVAFSLQQFSFGRVAVELSIAVVLLGALTIAGLLVARGILDSLIISTPFSYENVKRFRWAGMLMIAYNFIEQWMQIRFTQAVFANVQASGIELVRQFKISIGAPIVLGLFMFSLAEVFRYGLELKTDNDLTI